VNLLITPSAQVGHVRVQVAHYLGAVSSVALLKLWKRQELIGTLMQSYLLMCSTDGASIGISILVVELLELSPFRAYKVLIIFIVTKFGIVHASILQVVYGTG
jgi:hypothetical protein